MRKILTVAVREYNATVRTKAFLIGIILMPLMMGGSLLAQVLLKDTADRREKKIAVIDRTPGGKLYPILAAAVEKYNKFNAEAVGEAFEDGPQSPYALERIDPGPDTPAAILQQRKELSDRVRNRDLFGVLEIGAKAPLAEETAERLKAYQPRPGQRGPRKGLGDLPDDVVVRFQSNSPMQQSFPRFAEAVVNEVVRYQRGQAKGLGPEQVQLLTQQVFLVNRGLTTVNRLTGAIEDGREVNFLVTFFVPFVLVMLVFMVIMVGASPLMQGVIEEKMQRIAEVLLGSLSPFELMLGKLLGSVGVSLTLVSVYLVGGFWAAHHFGFDEYVRPETLAWLVAYQALAVLMYGAIFIAVGAAATDLKEAQALLTPVMLVVCLPMFVLAKVIQEPDSTLAVAASYFPTATPMVMVARQAVPPGLAWWEPVVGITGVLVTTLLMVWVAGRIFRVGILMQGKGASWADMVKWVFRG